MDQIICNAIRLLSNSEQASPKKAGLSSIRSLASLVPLVSFSMKHHRLAWLVNMSVLYAVYWCYIAVAVGAEESWNFQLPFGAAIVQGLPLWKTHLRIDTKLWDVFWLHENLKISVARRNCFHVFNCQWMSLRKFNHNHSSWLQNGTNVVLQLPIIRLFLNSGKKMSSIYILLLTTKNVCNDLAWLMT